jgi:hypothetical protein
VFVALIFVLFPGSSLVASHAPKLGKISVAAWSLVCVNNPMETNEIRTTVNKICRYLLRNFDLIEFLPFEFID